VYDVYSESIGSAFVRPSLPRRAYNRTHCPVTNTRLPLSRCAAYIHADSPGGSRHVASAYVAAWGTKAVTDLLIPVG